MISLNGQISHGDVMAHANHMDSFHPHSCRRIGKDCSGRWYCEKCKEFITGPKCTEGKK